MGSAGLRGQDLAGGQPWMKGELEEARNGVGMRVEDQGACWPDADSGRG